VILNELLRDKLAAEVRCPACGKLIADLPPDENMVTHWVGDCKKPVAEQPSLGLG